ncbi:Uncharacterized protein C22G7.07c [Colletotrichum chlorophyti]|uniref:Uncharacterized protein C22G7.07c n=1 Tax=Colletotrichum chlorophyti TaxID=708187 RepID=A0A1Q8RUC2_9PEZI|nr:Uncharacterized protein C22G7.07c [Colletotrichum chlorophyti]
MASSSLSEHDRSSSSSSRCILFRDESRSVFLVDIPASLEDAQHLPGRCAETPPSQRRLLSVEPVSAPFLLPEPRNPQTNHHTPASQLADLMIEAAVRSALDTLKQDYNAPFCLPRVTATPVSGGDRRKSPHNHPATKDGAAEDAAAAYFIPEESAYLKGSIEETRGAFLSTAPAFDLIVLDPPWPNKSARRKTGGYSTVHGLKETRRLLGQIPVAGHLADNGLVAIWVTNKASLVDLLTSPQGVLAAWGLEVITEWYWIKITSEGDPIFDTQSAWRKPWERLIIARKRGQTRVVPQKVIAAVPDEHSRKPNLRCLFEDLLPQGYRGLEVFARNLTAGWWGWGDQVVHFQTPQHWVVPLALQQEGPDSNKTDDTN